MSKCNDITAENLREKVATLLAYINYELDDLQQTKSALAAQSPDELRTLVIKGAIELKNKNASEALRYFETARNMSSDNNELIYNVALAQYRNKDYDKCMQNITEIIDNCSRKNPELCLEREASDKNQLQSVGNSLELKESALIETFNLKASIEYVLKNYNNAKEALEDMPFRNEEELDPVTLMNHALMNFEKDPSDGLKKLNYLLENPPFPPETFANLLLLYAKHEYFDLAADVLAQNSDLTFSFISSEDYEYLETLIFQNASKEEAAKKFEEIGQRHLEKLKKITKNIKNAQVEKNDIELQKSLKDYDQYLEKYIPVLMAQAKIFWNQKDPEAVERILKNAKDYCSINDIWRLNMAHVMFIQEKYSEAVGFYEMVYEKNIENLLQLPAIVIANMCVSLIMINHNEKAEDIIK